MGADACLGGGGGDEDEAAVGGGGGQIVSGFLGWEIEKEEAVGASEGGIGFEFFAAGGEDGGVVGKEDEGGGAFFLAEALDEFEDAWEGGA